MEATDWLADEKGRDEKGREVWAGWRHTLTTEVCVPVCVCVCVCACVPVCVCVCVAKGVPRSTAHTKSPRSQKAYPPNLRERERERERERGRGREGRKERGNRTERNKCKSPPLRSPYCRVDQLPW